MPILHIGDDDDDIEFFIQVVQAIDPGKKLLVNDRCDIFFFAVKKRNPEPKSGV
jgi:hypothetical protein